MFDDDEMEVYAEAMNQVSAGLKVVIGAANLMLDDDDVMDSLDSLISKGVSLTKVIFRKFEAEGFSREEALTLTCACLSKSSK